MPFYKCKTSSGITFRVYGKNVREALEIINNLEFYPFIKRNDGIIQKATVTLYKRPLNDCWGRKIIDDG